MKFFYNGKGYPCKWNSQIKSDNYWYSSEPIKLKVTIPRSLYDMILSEVKSHIFRLNLLIQKGEISRDRYKILADKNELWSMETHLNRYIICSTFRNDDVTVVFYLSLLEEIKLDNLELRNILLNDLLYKSENTE